MVRQRGTLDTLRQEVAKKLSETDTQNKESRVVAEQAREASADAQVKLGVLESRLAESQSQQIALEALYQELSRNRDEWAYAEIEQSLLIASQQLQLAGNVKAALIALQNADARLQRMERPQLTPLRKAINRDIERLKALPYVDTVGIAVRLDNVIAAVDTLPLAMEVRPPARRSRRRRRERGRAARGSASCAKRGAKLKQLVRVQNMDRPEVPLLAPSQTFFLRENLKLRLLGARLALLIARSDELQGRSQGGARMARQVLRHAREIGRQRARDAAQSARQRHQHRAARYLDDARCAAKHAARARAAGALKRRM